MPRIHFNRPNLLSKLHDEILAAHPDYRTILSVSGKDDDIWLSWDDAYTLDQASLSAIVAAHDPTPPPPAPTLNEQLAATLEAMQAAQTVDDLKPALAALAQALLASQGGGTPQP